MTTFNIGDAVSFTNERLEGKIIRILPGNIYRVEIEDGFTLDVTASEIVLRKSFLSSQNISEKPSDAQVIPLKSAELSFEEVFKKLKGFHLLAIPWPGQTLSKRAQIWLFNGTEQDQLFAYTISQDGSDLLTGHGIVLPGKAERIPVADDSKSSGTKWKFGIRWMSAQKDTDQLPAVQTRNFTIESPTLEQTDSALPAPYCFARYHLLTNIEQPDISAAEIDALYSRFKTEEPGSRKESAKAVSSKKTVEKSGEVFKRFGLSPSLHEIDLHIEELTSEPGGITVADMLNIQMNAFRKSLDKALLSGQKELIVIHGVGNGRLKEMVRKELKELGYRYNDAPYDRYGSGATKILLGS